MLATSSSTRLNNQTSQNSAYKRSCDWSRGDERPYGELAYRTFKRLANRLESKGISIQETNVDEGFAIKDSLNGRFHLWAHQWSFATDQAIATARMVLIQGQRTEIINTWVFPIYPSILPVFAAELISMGGQQKLSFIDIQNPGMVGGHDRIVQETEPLISRFQHLRIEETPPAWAISDTLGNYIFRREGEASQFPEVADAYMSYLNTYIEVLLPALLSEATETWTPAIEDTNHLPIRCTMVCLRSRFATRIHRMRPNRFVCIDLSA
jgi:hypothetical protein